MGVIVDTSIWVNVERRRLTHTQVAARVGNEPVFLSPPVAAELEYGVARAQTDAQRNKRMSALAKIKKKPCLIIDQETGAIFGRIAAKVDNGGRPHTHRVNDLWIAALAIQHGFKVLTENPADFRDVPGLTVLAIRDV